MVEISSWLPGAVAALALALTVYAMVALTRWAARVEVRRRAAVARLLANPEQLQRVWFVQLAANSHPQLVLRGRDRLGKEVTLASPADAPKVWHQLQLAGIVVHQEP